MLQVCFSVCVSLLITFINIKNKILSFFKIFANVSFSGVVREMYDCLFARLWPFITNLVHIWGQSNQIFINNAKLGEGSLYRLCMNVWEMNHLLFSITEFLFNHAINLFLCFSICLKMAQRKCRIGFCLITFEIAVKINLKIKRNFFVHNIDCKIHSFQHFKNYFICWLIMKTSNALYFH